MDNRLLILSHEWPLRAMGGRRGVGPGVQTLQAGRETP